MSRRWTEQEAPPPLDLRLVPPALAVWGGCLVGLCATRWALWACSVTGVVLLGLGVRALAGRGRTPTGDVTAGLVAAAVCFAVGTGLAALRMHAAASDPLVQAAARGDWATVSGTVSSDPATVDPLFPVSGEDDQNDADPTRSARARWRLSVSADNAEIRGTTVGSAVTVTVFGDGPAWAALRTGERVQVRGVVAPDDFGALPGATLRAVGTPSVTGDPPWWSAWAARARTGLTRSASVLDADRGGLLRGVVVGDTSGIDQQLTADAKATGLTHLVAVSGSHVALIAGLVLLVLRRAGPRIAAAGAGLTLAGLVVLVGPQPSVLRAVAMGVIGLAAAVLGRSRAALPGLAAAVFALLLLDPALALSVGFALSVQATGALVLLAPAWIRALQRRGVPRGWAQLLVLPVAAQLATMPVIAAISGTVSLVAVPANILVTPVVAPALLIGLACTAVGPWWPDAGEFLARVDGPLLGWIAGTAHHLARWPAATVPWPASPGGVMALAGLTLAALLVLRHRRVRAALLAVAVGVAVVLIPSQVTTVGWPVAGWLLTACEVGQGDGMVLSTGTPGTAVVVDTGPDPALMDACLDRLDVTTVPLLVLTHLHADHVGGLAGVLHGRSVGAIGVGPDREPAPAWGDVLGDARHAGVPVVALHPGTRWASGDLALTVLAPDQAYHGTDSDPNNDSVVMMAVDRGVRILMTGDIEKVAQRALLDSGTDLHADVLKQPHHGSAKVLPEFLAAVSPQVAVIGVGAGNDYGQPSPTALRADRAAGVATILRTDTDGDVQVALSADGLTTVKRGRSLRGAAPAADD
jgi:competence protein ComEC